MSGDLEVCASTIVPCCLHFSLIASHIFITVYSQGTQLLPASPCWCWTSHFCQSHRQGTPTFSYSNKPTLPRRRPARYPAPPSGQQAPHRPPGTPGNVSMAAAKKKRRERLRLTPSPRIRSGHAASTSVARSQSCPFNCTSRLIEVNRRLRISRPLVDRRVKPPTQRCSCTYVAMLVMWSDASGSAESLAYKAISSHN